MKPSRAGISVLALVLGLAAVILVAGFASSYQVLSARWMLERIEQRNLRELAASSAFEEACARLQGELPRVPLLRAGESRDLATVARWPGSSAPLNTLHQVDPAISRADFARAGIELPGPVSVQSSAWDLELGDGPDGTKIAKETGIVKISTRLRVRQGAGAATYEVRARRYFIARPSQTRPELELAIGSSNLCLEVVERP